MTSEGMIENAEFVAGILKAMAHPGRLLILCHLMDGPKNVNDLSQSCSLGQSHTSQYLNQLFHQGILEKERSGKEVFYQLKNNEIKNLMNSLYEIYCSGEVA